MNYYYGYFLIALSIFCKQYSMNSANAEALQMMQSKELQRAINEDSVKKFLNCISACDEKTRLKAFRAAVIQKADAITHNIPSHLKDQLLVCAAAKHKSRTVTEFLTQLPTYQYSAITDDAFFEALNAKHFKIAKVLLDRGANMNRLTHDIFEEDPSDSDNDERKTLLHHAVYDGDEDRIPLIKWLLEQGADPDTPSLAGDSPLHDIAWDEDAASELLCDHGADPNARDSKGNTALMSYITSGSTWDHKESKCLVQIIEAGANINARNNYGETALHLAAWEGNSCTASILLHYGADKEICDNDNHTPYQHTFLVRFNLTRYLLSNPANVAIRALLSNPILPPLPQIAVKTQKAIKKKKSKIP
ncbi:hypothetical protein BH09DEP1_BH09DEP1_4310 [soil metagenome]